MGVAKSTAQTRREALLAREASEAERWAVDGTRIMPRAARGGTAAADQRPPAPSAPGWASGDDFAAVAELLGEHGFTRQPDEGDGTVHWISTRTDLPTLRVWIGPYWPSPGSVHGTDQPTIQTNDAYDNNGKGKDCAVGKLSSPVARKMLADYLTSREQEGYYDPDY